MRLLGAFSRVAYVMFIVVAVCRATVRREIARVQDAEAVLQCVFRNPKVCRGGGGKRARAVIH